MARTINLSFNASHLRARAEVLNGWCRDDRLLAARQSSVRTLCAAGVDVNLANDLVDDLIVEHVPVVVGRLIDASPLRGRSFDSIGQMIWTEDSEEMDRARCAAEIDDAATFVTTETVPGRRTAFRAYEAGEDEIESFE